MRMRERRFPTPTLYSHVEWEKFYPYFRRSWKQGEHVAIVGPTGSGKTLFESYVLPVRQYVVILVTKVHDDTISKEFPQFERITKWPPKATQDKVLLWPTLGKKDSIRDTQRKQHYVFKDALDKIFKDRNWCVVFDEQHYTCNTLRLEHENAMLLHQGRSSGLSIVNGTQRPAWVPVVTYSSATHAVIWRTTFKNDLKRLSELGGIDERQLARNILDLDKHEFIYVNTRTGDIMRSQVRR